MKGGQDRFLIGKERLFLDGLLQSDVGANAAGIKNVPADGRTGGPDAIYPFYPVIGLAALKTRRADEIDLGNRSAVAAPMRAVALWIWASALRTSGRRSKSSDGRVMGISGGLAGIGAAGDSSFTRAEGPLPSSTLRL